MEDRSNKNIICSVLFLDIVEYSKKTVTGQISLKERFNTYLSEAIEDVPVNDRIILDTGDGAAVNFLGDIEAALKAALSLRASLLNEDPYLEPELLVRIGINMGPVRLVRDINGQPNIVGDGINVAQRIMAFADPSQILVSRSYYDAVSHISAQYTGMFHYQGSRTDKHVREHEIYAIGYPGDQTTRRMSAPQAGLARLGALFSSRTALTWSERIAAMGQGKLALYAIVMIVPVLLLLMLLPEKKYSEPVAVATVETMQSASDVAPVIETMANSAGAKIDADVSKRVEERVSQADSDKSNLKPVPGKSAAQSVVLPKHKTDQAGKNAQAVSAVAEGQVKASTVKKSASTSAFFPDLPGSNSEPVKEAYISIICKEETQVFVDGVQKGKIGSGAMTIALKPGKHKLILTHAKFGFYSEEIDVDAGKTEHIKPKVCN
ncbi:MAG: adenylate/guanylate cyclase domain-containing protein [Gallionella sp.]|jgi:hypothetical protein